MTQRDEFELTTDIVEELRKVRESGRANMLDIRSVQLVARDLDLHCLVVWAQNLQGLPRSSMTATWMDALEKL